MLSREGWIALNDVLTWHPHEPCYTLVDQGTVVQLTAQEARKLLAEKVFQESHA